MFAQNVQFWRHNDYQQYQDQPVVLKRAYMLKDILENMTIYIEDDTLIAGNQASEKSISTYFSRVCYGLGHCRN